ncbi:MAG: hypothetical protein AAFR77_03815 [Cyanobacteria bacterium J06631_2]
MDLKAKRKKQNSVQQVDKLPTPAPIETASDESANTYEHSITIQCNTLLYTTLQNTVKALHTGNDFTYTSVTDIIRAALKAYQEGMELTEIDQSGKKKQTSIRVDNSLYKFYKSLPNQLRTKIIEKAIRTHIKNM